MKIHSLSPSKLKSARLCEARLMSKLEDVDYEEEKGEGAAMGTLAHEAAMIWYRNEDGKATDPGEVFRQAIDSCSKGMFGNENPRDNDSISEARALFEQIITYYKREAIKVVFAERRYKGTIANGVPVHLIIDLAIDRGNGQLEIVDYKTGFIAMTTEDMWSEDQVLMNLLAVSTDPELKQNFNQFSFKYFWVRNGYETGPISLTADRLADYEYYLASEYQRLLDLTEPKERINPYCGTCPRRLRCEKYRELMTEAMNFTSTSEDGVMTPEEFEKLTDEQLMEQHSKINSQMKLLEKGKSAINAHLLALHKKRDEKVIEAGPFKSTVVQSGGKSYDTMTVLSMCQAYNVAPASVLSPTNKRVETAFGDNQEAMSVLNATASKSAYSAWPKISASKPAKGKKNSK